MAQPLLGGPVSFGRFILDPAEARLIGPDGAVRLGRKAMRLLEALAAEPGRLISKEALFESVWDGMSVSESALTAAIKELRRALGDEARHPCFIQSVYGRGYRFIVPVAPASLPETVSSRAPMDEEAPLPPVGAPSRRALLGLGAAVAAAGAAALIVRPHGLLRPSLSGEVTRLTVQARHMMDQNTRVGQYEAIGMLRRVVDLAPSYADGWGMLGMAYAVPSHYRERQEGLILRARARAAGRHALELDPTNAYGELALGIELPFVGFWAERDSRFARAMANLPDNDDVLTFMAVVLQFNGRSSAALPYYQRIRQRPLTPAAYSNYIRALWSSGRVEETDRALEDALALYPTQATLWFDRFNIWMYGGQPDAATAFALDATSRPSGVDDAVVAWLMAQAAAVRKPDSDQARRTVAKLAVDARRDAGAAQEAIRLAAATGAIDIAFAVADAYYLNGGYAVPDTAMPGSVASIDQRQTRFLFEPETASLRANPRFERLVAAIGLDRYWRTTGVQPDYRLQRAAQL